MPVFGKSINPSVLAKVADQATPPVIRAYHGSPYDFDKFDASKIGTGEGAQAYGHGLYFAGNEAVAQSYRRALAGAPEPMDLAIDGDPVFRRSWPMLPGHHKAGTNYLISRLLNYSDEYAPEALGQIRQDLPRLIEHYSANPEGHPISQQNRLNELRGAMDLLDNGCIQQPRTKGFAMSDDVDEGSAAMLGSLAWIPVSERLPPYDERVLYCAEIDGKFGHEVNAGRWDGRRTYPNADGSRACVMDYGDEDGDWEPCTHWMPLPAPPTDAKQPANHNVTVLPSRNPGRSYEVELGVPESSMLDWDQLVEEQSDSVRSAVTRLLGDDQVSGQYAYKELEQNLGSPRWAAETLKAAGVPGIRYFDGGSRRFGEGTRNYVMFPGTEDSIRILRKYGLLGPAAIGAMQQDDSP